MKNTMKKILSALLAVFIFSLLFNSSSLFAQEVKKTPMHNMKNMKHEKNVKADTSIVHKGVIDLKAIDKNNDGKVFQDPMDWNVISDKPGKCPLCKMNLQEVTVKGAKKNLVKNGFKVK